MGQHRRRLLFLRAVLALLGVELLSVNGCSAMVGPEREKPPRRATMNVRQSRDDVVETIFASNPEWEGWNADVTKTWRSLLPRWQLVREEGFNNGEPYGIAMFHQIHCIVDIRQHYSSLIGVNGTSDEERDLAKTEKEKAHMAHCFNWLRQSILCSADNTKELLRPDPNGGFVDKTKHACGSSEALYDLGNGYFAPDESGELIWKDRVRSYDA